MLGKLIVDIAGTELNQIEKKYLSHDFIGGVILFTRNFENKNQLLNLCTSIKAIKKELRLFKKLFNLNLIHLTTYISNKERLERKVSDIERRFEPIATLPQ